MDVHRLAAHYAHSLTEDHIAGGAVFDFAGAFVIVGGGGPVEGIVVHTEEVHDGGAVEELVNGGTVGDGGRSGVVNQALQFFDIGYTPVGVAEIFNLVHLLCPGQCIFPVHGTVAVVTSTEVARVVLHPHEGGGLVGDGLVAVVNEEVHAIVCVATDIVAVVSHLNAIALDATVGKVGAKEGGVLIHGHIAIDGGAEHLRVDETLANGLIAIAEHKVICVNIGVNIGATREVDEGVDLFDGGDAPIAVATQGGLVEGI